MSFISDQFDENNAMRISQNDLNRQFLEKLYNHQIQFPLKKILLSLALIRTLSSLFPVTVSITYNNINALSYTL